jgi:Cof subfamily protein (haloacid dehalogenase superfamily)
MVKVIFFDIDGTLVSFKNQAFPTSAKTAIDQLRSKGIKMIIATGRAYSDINNLDGIQFDGYITSNGACCMNSQGEIIAQQFISKENLHKLAQYMEVKPFPCEFMTDEGTFINYFDDAVLFLRNLIKIPDRLIKPVSQIIEYNVFQLGAFVSLDVEKELLKDVLTDCVGARWYPTFADFNAKNCNKATGMDIFLKRLGVDREHTMAFGDGGNDIPMLKHAAIGIAMGNAGDDVKAVADYVTDTVEEDGVINALKNYRII